MKKNIIIAAAIIALVSLAYFKSLGSREAAKVALVTAEVKEIKSSILASGTLIYKEQVQLRSEVIGQGQRGTNRRGRFRFTRASFNASRAPYFQC
jgi:HlyD family secretion protein